jgi:hypothetical protein
MAQIKVEKVDLNHWEVESYTTNGGRWTVSADGQQVVQSINGEPTFFYSPFNVFNTKVSGKILVGNSGDDDYVGFALGFTPEDTKNASAKYVLVDWKKGTQDYGGATAKAGVAVSLVNGIPPSTPDLWGHTGKVTELARGKTLGSTGWQNNVEYSFDFVYTQTSLQISVNGNLEIDIKGDFKEGRIAFYNYSQDNVTYKAFESKVLPSGQLEVPAINEAGVDLTNPIETEAKIKLTPSGTWSVKEGEEVTAAGKAGAELLDHLTYPNNTPYSLVAVDKGSGVAIAEVGGETVITLQPGQTVAFKINDEPGWYWDNKGSIAVDWMVMD